MHRTPSSGPASLASAGPISVVRVLAVGARSSDTPSLQLGALASITGDEPGEAADRAAGRPPGGRIGRGVALDGSTKGAAGGHDALIRGSAAATGCSGTCEIPPSGSGSASGVGGGCEALCGHSTGASARANAAADG
eukprot:TRINITY_DN39264_c0_g1_i1.p3 TRINITY_DN39264_c0_g1~~TRINITY_DN39264_c0_g1_i1.p3  ORF type:complete len:137 (+),score=18.84 TRINITY_DN39264_c0_g1_i1:210-620(+)